MSLILALNAGPSSLILSLYKHVEKDPDAPCLLLTCNVSSISFPPAKVEFQHIKKARVARCSSESIHSHASGVVFFCSCLQDSGIDCKQISHICHRMVHGIVQACTSPSTLSPSPALVLMSRLSDRHNAIALPVIDHCLNAMPYARSIAFFDTAFHKDIPRHVSVYAINQKIAQEHGLRKYGFHGLSYAFIKRAVAKHLHKGEDELNIIALRLGSGASACAIRGGKFIDTSMGLTPSSGLPGATRAGDVDPSLIFHYPNDPLSRWLGYGITKTEGMHITRAEEVLNNQSGWKALAGTTDFGEITKRADMSAPSTENPYTLAFQVVLDRVLHYVGAYHLSLRGKVDALVFAGGVGERSRELRSAVGEAVNNLGYSAIDEHVNQELDRYAETVVDIGKSDGEKRVLVCRTDVQFEMARGCSLTEDFWH